MSDFYKLTTTILWKIILKGATNWNYILFNQSNFESDLQAQLSALKDPDYTLFEQVFLETLNNAAPVKIKIICYNHNLFYGKITKGSSHGTVKTEK